MTLRLCSFIICLFSVLEVKSTVGLNGNVSPRFIFWIVLDVWHRPCAMLGAAFY